jgi:hypothetical protein
MRTFKIDIMGEGSTHEIIEALKFIVRQIEKEDHIRKSGQAVYNYDTLQTIITENQ